MRALALLTFCAHLAVRRRACLFLFEGGWGLAWSRDGELDTNRQQAAGCSAITVGLDASLRSAVCGERAALQVLVC